MFTNIGKKIKVLAAILCGVGIGLNVIGAIIMFVFAAQNRYYSWMFVLYGVILLIIGPLFSWVGSWILYGFGELIDKTAEIERNTNPYYRRMNAPYPPQYPPQYQQYPPRPEENYTEPEQF